MLQNSVVNLRTVAFVDAIVVYVVFCVVIHHALDVVLVPEIFQIREESFDFFLLSVVGFVFFGGSEVTGGDSRDTGLTYLRAAI